MILKLREKNGSLNTAFENVAKFRIEINDIIQAVWININNVENKYKTFGKTMNCIIMEATLITRKIN